MIAIALALVMAVVFHEAGHLTAALVLNFRLLGISLGPVRVSFWHGRRTWKLSSQNLFTGSVSAIPPDSKQWRARMLAVVASGPAATFISGLMAGYLLLAIQGPTWLMSFLGALSQLSFFLFVLGFIPNSARNRVRNDARLFWIICRGGPAADEIRTYHEIMQTEASGIRPGAIPASLIRKLAVSQSTADLELLCARTVVNWAIDRGDIASASAWDLYAFNIAKTCDERLRNSATAASGCFDILFRGNLNAARSKFAAVEFDSLTPECFRYRAQAAYWLAAGDIPAAMAAIARARYSFPAKLPYYDFETRLLSALHHEAVSMRAPEPVTHRANRL